MSGAVWSWLSLACYYLFFSPLFLAVEIVPFDLLLSLNVFSFLESPFPPALQRWLSDIVAHATFSHFMYLFWSLPQPVLSLNIGAMSWRFIALNFTILNLDPALRPSSHSHICKL